MRITAVSTVHSGKGTKTRCESAKAKTTAIVRPVFLNFRAERFPWDRGVAHCKLQRQGLRDRGRGRRRWGKRDLSISQTGGRACAKEGYAFRPSSDSAQLHSPTANVTEAMQCLGERAA